MIRVTECANNGIYFLFLGDKLQYIGKSKNVFSRFIAHRGEFDFDNALIFPCPDTNKCFDDSSLREIEKWLIYLFAPKKNTQHCMGEFHEIPFEEKLKNVIECYAEDRIDKEYGIKRISQEKPKGKSYQYVTEWLIECVIDSRRRFWLWEALREAESIEGN